MEGIFFFYLWISARSSIKCLAFFFLKTTSNRLFHNKGGGKRKKENVKEKKNETDGWRVEALKAKNKKNLKCMTSSESMIFWIIYWRRKKTIGLQSVYQKKKRQSNRKREKEREKESEAKAQKKGIYPNQFTVLGLIIRHFDWICQDGVQHHTEKKKSKSLFGLFFVCRIFKRSSYYRGMFAHM